jgi:hypothetical protein
MFRSIAILPINFASEGLVLRCEQWTHFPLWCDLAGRRHSHASRQKPACSRRRTATLTPMYGSFLTWMSCRCRGDALTPHFDRRQHIGVLGEDARRSILPDFASDQTGIRIHLPRQVNVDSQCQAQHGVASRTCSSCPSMALTAFGSAI